MSKRGKVAIALGGGGARGLAHIGVLKILEEAQIPIDYVSGTSVGALVGALYALEPDSLMLYKKFLSFLRSPLYRKARFNRLVHRNKSVSDNFWIQAATVLKQRLVVNFAQSRISVISSKRVESFFKFFLARQTFQHLKLPYIASSVDLITGCEVFHTTGELVPTVMASSAIPGFMPPVEYQGKLLIDGVVLNPVPVQPARFLGADLVIAIDVGRVFPQNPVIENVVDVLLRTQQITAQRHHQNQIQEADLVIRPDVGAFHWAEFHRHKAIMAAGELATRQVLPVIRESIKNLKPTKKHCRLNLTQIGKTHPNRYYIVA